MRPPSLKAADFQRALGARPVARTAHFTLHIVWHEPPGHGRCELSTGGTPDGDAAVDDSDPPPSSLPTLPCEGLRFGLVLPKKQARRSVTRSLIRHQAREALRRHAPRILSRIAKTAPAQSPCEAQRRIEGWVLRLRAPFDRQQFPSAASDALKRAVREELETLWAGVKLDRRPEPPRSEVIAPSRGAPKTRPAGVGEPRGAA